jgi:hypothetical protein
VVRSIPLFARHMTFAKWLPASIIARQSPTSVFQNSCFRLQHTTKRRLTKTGYETIQGYKYECTYKYLPYNNAGIWKQNIIHVGLHICMYIRTYVRMYIYIYIYIYIYMLFILQLSPFPRPQSPLFPSIAIFLSSFPCFLYTVSTAPSRPGPVYPSSVVPILILSFTLPFPTYNTRICNSIYRFTAVQKPRGGTRDAER